MKKVRKVLIAVLSVMLLVCLGLFAAACDDGDEPAPAEKIYYTVTVAEYDAAQGTVALDPAAQDGKYEENTSVTVTATPNADYEVEAVKANGSALTANGEGKYVFTVSGDTTVAVTFKAKTVTPPPVDEKVNVTVTCGSEGSYTLDPAPVDGQVAKGASVTLTVTPNANYEVDSVKVNGSAVTANGEGKYVFTANADTTVEITFKAQGEVPPVDEKVNVTVTCGSEGSYTLDPAPVDGQVAKGASVTLTVTPDDGYVIYDVTVNGRPATKGEGAGVYTFTADADTTVNIVFHEDTSTLPEAGVEFGLTWQGTWKSLDESVTIVIGAKTMTFNAEPVTGVTNGSDTSGQSYAFTAGGKSYQLEVASEGFTESSLLVLVSGSEKTYVAHSFVPEIEDKYQGHWYATNSDIEMEITASEVTYNSSKAAFVVDAGYVEKIGDGDYVTEVNAHIYVMLVGDNLYTLIWDGTYVSVGDTLFSKSKSSFVIPNEDYPGEWEGVTTPGDTLSIETVGGVVVVKYNGEEVSVNLNAEFKHNGKDYDFTASENILTLHENVYMDDNPDILAGQKSYFFVKKDCSELTIAEQDLLGTSWSAAGITLTVSQEGKITVNDTLGKIVSQLAHDNGVGKFSYTVVAGTDVYDVYHDTAATLYVESRSGYQYTLGNGQIEPQFIGTWNKSASGTVGSQLVISQEDGCTFEGKSITLLRSGIVDGYVFTVTDEEGDSKTYTIQLLMDFEAYLLGVSYVENNATENAYYLKETTVPPVTIADELVGSWTGGGEPLSIYKGSITYGPHTATVFENTTDIDSDKYISYFVYANGDLYLLLYNKNLKQIEFRNYGSADGGMIYSTKTEHETSEALPEKYHGKWADDKGNTIVVDEEGKLYYNGKDAVLTKVREDYYNATVGLEAWSLQWEEDGRICWFNSVFDNYLYFEKLNEVTGQILQWFTDGTLKETVANGNTVVVKGLFSGGQKGWNGFVVDINVNNAWYRLRMDPAAFGLNSTSNDTNTWTQPQDAMYEQLAITDSAWNEANYLALYAEGGKAWVVVEATLLDNKLTYVVKTYAGTDSKLQTVVTTTTFVLTSTSPVDSLEIAYYFDNDGNTVVLEEAYVDTIVRHSVDVTCTEGEYELSPNAWNEKYYEEGTEVTLSVTAPDGKVVDSVTVNEQPVEATGSVYKFTVDSDTTVVVTFKESEGGGDVGGAVFSTEQQGKYTDPSGMYSTTLEITADSVIFNCGDCALCSDGPYTFKGAELVKVSDTNYTLSASGLTFNITFNDDGTILFEDPGWAAGGDVSLSKNA